MEALKVKEYQISRMTIEKNVISWEGNAVRLPGVVRIWVGTMPKRTFPMRMVLILLMIALSGERLVNMAAMLAILGIYIAVQFMPRKQPDKGKGENNHVNLELCNGRVYSFASGDEAFAARFYEVLENLLEDDTGDSHYDIVFENGGEIINYGEQEESEAPSSVMEIRVSEGQGAQIVQELRKLYTSYTKKTDSDSEVLSLINEAAGFIEKGDKPGLKAAYEKFVTLGLINDCNELSLDSLLQEIRATIY